MNAYQQKWLSILKAANIPNWEMNAINDGILIKMSNVTDLKVIRDNLPETLAALSLDIDVPKQRLKFIFENGYEKFDYILNPSADDLNKY